MSAERLRAITMRAFAAATRQLWKYRIFNVLTAAATLTSVGFFSIVWYENPWHLPFRLTTAFYFATGIVWFAWFAAAITCPKCRKRPVWHLMAHGGTWSTGGAVGAPVRCPMCGYDPPHPQAPTRNKRGLPKHGESV
jgi:hypothetical protein